MTSHSITEAFKAWHKHGQQSVPGRESWPFSRDHLVFVVAGGSHAYGMATESSDFDFCGVTMPKALVTIQPSYQQTELAHEYEGVKCEGKVYSIVKYFLLAAQANPNIIEQLWVDPSHILYNSTVGDAMFEARNHFMSKKLGWTFSGYAVAQMKKIRNHRKWLLSPPTHRPTRSEFGLPDNPSHEHNVVKAAVQKRIDSWALDLDGLDPDRRLEVQDTLQRSIEDYVSGVTAERLDALEARTLAAGVAIGLPDEYLARVQAEARYEDAIASWNKYQAWAKNRNPARAQLEAQFGYDTKHGSHVVRLGRQGLEALRTGVMQTKRPDAEELLAIRRGAWTYDQLEEYAASIDAEFKEAMAMSPLSSKPDLKTIDNILTNCVEMWGS